MIEVRCRICKNCDAKNSRCKLYGNDLEKAVKQCAANGFSGYKTATTKKRNRRVNDG